MANAFDQFDSQPNAFDQFDSAPAQSQPQVSPIDNYENATVKQLGKWGTGLMGVGTQAAGATGAISPETEQNWINNIQAGRATLDKMYPTQPGISSWIGQNIFGNLPAFVPGSPALSGAVSGAMNAGIADAPVTDTGLTKAEKAGIGGLTGAATGRVLEGVFGAAANRLTPEESRLADVMKDEGIPLTAGQQTGNKTLQTAEAAFSNMPFTSTVAEDARTEQAQAYTQAVLKKAGMTDDFIKANPLLEPETNGFKTASPNLLNSLYQDVGGRIGSITQGQPVNVDNKLVQDVLDTQKNYGDSIIEPLQKSIFNKFSDDITQGNVMPGDTYQNTRSQLGRIAQGSWSNNPTFARALDKLQDNLDQAMERSLPADKAAELSTARGQYGNLKNVMRAMTTTTQDTIAGFVPPARLAQSLIRGNPTGYVTGSGDLNDLARGGNAFLKNTIGDSGTAARLEMSDLLRGAPLAIGAETGETTPGKLAMAVGLTGLPYALQAVYNRVPGYFVNGVPVFGSVPALSAAGVAGGSLIGGRLNQ